VSVLYFAYGSNLKIARMCARAPSARPAGIAVLPGYRLVCNKRGADGSAKANLQPAPEEETWGALYRLSAADLLELDRFEGGYQRIQLPVWRPGGEALEAETYRSQQLTDDPVPSEEYRTLLLEGAREHALPPAHQARLAALPWRPNPTPNR